MKASMFRAVGAVLLFAMMGAPAYAQATRTWVSGVGDDANPCSRTAPCKTFAGAISKTAAAGEISVLDPGGFGTVVITKSITLSGDGTLAGILAGGTNGITINAQPTDVVVLRNLSIKGTSGATNGVRVLAARAVVIDRVSIEGFTTNGVEMALGSGVAGSLAIRDSIITGLGSSIGVRLSSGLPNASLNRVSIQNATDAVHTFVGNADVSNSTLSQNSGFAVRAESGSSINVVSSMLTGNGVAAQAEVGGTVRLINNDVYNNQSGFGCGGTLASSGNNRKANNVGGAIPVCAPNATVTVQ